MAQEKTSYRGQSNWGLDTGGQVRTGESGLALLGVKEYGQGFPAGRQAGDLRPGAFHALAVAMSGSHSELATGHAVVLQDKWRCESGQEYNFHSRNTHKNRSDPRCSRDQTNLIP